MSPSTIASSSVSKSAEKPRPLTTHWAYPFALRDSAAADSMQNHFAALSPMNDGFFPLNHGGFPNGSIFVGSNCKDYATEDGFRCLADGEVVAYRLDGRLNTLRYDEERKLRYSLGFVLVRHHLALPPEVTAAPAAVADDSAVKPASPITSNPTQARGGIDIFSLYSYNRPLDQYKKDKDGFLTQSLPFWQGHHRYRVGVLARDLQIPPPPPEPHMLFGYPVPVPPPTDLPAPVMGLRVRSEGHGKARIIGLLPRDCILQVRGEASQGWAQIAVIERGEPLAYTIGEQADLAAIAEGWIYLDELDRTPIEVPVDQVVVLSAPHPVKAGAVLGYLGENPARELAQRNGDIQPSAPLVAIEVFAGDDFPDYLAEARRRAAALPDEQKAILVIESGATLCSGPRQPNHLFTSDFHVVPGPRSPKGGPLTFGRLCRAEPREPKAPLAKGESATDFRVSADGKLPIRQADFEALPPDEKSRYPMCAVLVPVDGPGDCWGDRRQLLYGGVCYVWTQRPMVPAEGTIPVGLETCLSRSQLGALHESRRFVDIDGCAWWQVVVGNDANEAAFGWVCGKDHPGTRWESPHAWPGFQLADGRAFEPMEALQRAVFNNGSVHATHRESFGPIASALNGSDMIVKLEQAIDRAGTLDGKVTGSDIARARRLPWLARSLSRLVCHINSQWSDDVARWMNLSPIMIPDWKPEMERQAKRGWWKHAVGKVEGFPPASQVHFIHPLGWVDNFLYQAIDQELDALFTELGSLISSGEGSYEAYNAGTKGVPLKDGKKHVQYGYMTRPKGTVTGKTINEILSTDSLSGMDPNRFFATGKYQTIISTLSEAKDKLGLSGEELYDERMQERVFRDHLLMLRSGRTIRNFITSGQGSIEDVQYAAAKIWASICAPLGYEADDGTPTTGRHSYFVKDGANHASIPSTEALKAFLERVRSAHASGQIRAGK